MANTSLVRPKLEYSASIWDPNHQSKIDKIEHVQNRAARFVMNKPWRRSDRSNQESATSMVNSLGWETLQQRRKNARVTLMYKVYHNCVDVPSSYLPPRTTVNTRGTHAYSLRQIPCNVVEIYRNFFFPRTVVDWNRLPLGVVSTPTVEQFKAALSRKQTATTSVHMYSVLIVQKTDYGLFISRRAFITLTRCLYRLLSSQITDRSIIKKKNTKD